MRVVLQDSKSGQYVRGSGLWTFRGEEAMNFQRSAEAVRFAQEERLTDLSVIFTFDSHSEEVTLPLGMFTQAGVIDTSAKARQETV